jgi:hypothetical protein
MKKKKLSSYQKLKKKYSKLWNLYVKARTRLNSLGEGISGNDIILDCDMEIRTR